MKRRQTRPADGAALLREWIDRRGLSQREAAEILGISEPYIHQLLFRKRWPALSMAVAITRETGIPVDRWALTDVDKAADTTVGPPVAANKAGR